MYCAVQPFRLSLCLSESAVLGTEDNLLQLEDTNICVFILVTCACG